jgi:hypothetical protein
LLQPFVGHLPDHGVCALKQVSDYEGRHGVSPA